MADVILHSIYDKCYQFSIRVLYLPKGKPDFVILDCPSDVFPTLSNTADSNNEKYRVRINRLWAENCLKCNRQAEIEFQIFHELRHLHQYAAIRRYRETGETGYDNSTLIEAWDKNYAPGNYIYNDNSGITALRQYNSQPVERDANAYGWLLLKILHSTDGVDTSLNFPDEAEADFFAYQDKREIQDYYSEQLNKSSQPAKGVPFVRTKPKIGANDPCPCGSGKKYKKCTCSQYH
ncbi:MAG: SEC-C domain-containing protein [Clostridia bacterium]|nr:SEC-C domain-containing protein [Clostridia bacterium]